MTTPRPWDIRMCELHGLLTHQTRALDRKELRELSAGIDGLLIMLATVKAQAQHAYDTGSALSGSTTLAQQILRTMEGET